MKNKIKLYMAALVTLVTVSMQAQTISLASIQALLNDKVITVGTPFTINGVTGLVTTNAAGNYVVTVTGAAGTISGTPPSTLGGVVSTGEGYVAANNPTNIDFYGTNDLELRLGAVYMQNSGEAAVDIGIEKFGLIKAVPQIGLEADLYEGNTQGRSGTAAAAGFVNYRKPIGDVAIEAGIGGGWDNWNQSWMGAAKVEVEYRQNPHLSEYVGVGYALEKDGFSSTSQNGGLLAGGGVKYSF